jgi:adenylate cyclase class IV
MKFQIDNIVLRIYYELSLFENCFSLIDSVTHFIKTNKQSTKIYKVIYTNFLKAYKELLRCRLKPDNSRLLILKNKILHEPTITSKKWLLEKIGDL